MMAVPNTKRYTSAAIFVVLGLWPPSVCPFATPPQQGLRPWSMSSRTFAATTGSNRPISTLLYNTAVNETELLLPDAAVTENVLETAETSQKAQTTLDTSTSTTSTTSPPPYPPTPTIRECMAFVLPALGIYICSPLMSLIDAAFVGNARSSLELAALGPASAVSDSAHLPLLFLSIAATNLISVNATDTATVARVSRMALSVGAVCSVGLAAALYAGAAPLCALYCGKAGAALVPAAATYVSVRALALPAVVITTIAQAICIGTKDSQTPMVSVAVASVCNLLGDFWWVQPWGMQGAAAATAASQVLAAVLLLRVLHKRGFLERKAENQTISRRVTFQQLISFVPFLFVMSVKIFWHNACSATAASLGGIPAAAHTAVLSVAMVCMVLGDVGSSLSQAFLPPFLRHQTFDMPAALPTIRQLLKCTLSISATVMTLAALLIGVWGGSISSDPAVVTEMRRVLPWILATLSFHGSVVTLEGLLLSRQKFMGLSVCYSFLAVLVAGFSWATRQFHWGLSGVWGCYLSFCCIRFGAFLTLGELIRPRHWFQRPWQTKTECR